MSLFETEKRDDVTVVRINGEIDGKTAAEIQGKIIELVQPQGKLLIDMSNVSYMSSAGLRVLLSTHRQVTSNSARLALSGLSADVNETMAATGFLPSFTVFETVDEGLAGLR